MEVKPGYKQTEVGIIPEDWGVKRLEELLTYEQPTKYLVSSSAYSDVHAVPVLTAGKTFILGYTDEEERVFRDLPVIIFDDFTTAIQYVPFPFKAKSSAMKLLKPRHPFANLKLIYDMMQLVKFQVSEHKRHWISEYRKLKIKVPSANEQTAIATVLSDMDDLLGSLERLIAKKRDLKQATMQQLLSGQTRLPGFHGEWEVKRLEEVCDIRSGGTPLTSQTHFWDGGIPWCTPTDITALRGHKYMRDTARTISAVGLLSSAAEVIPPRSLTMTSRATIGICAINLVPMATNQGFKNIVPFEAFDVEFLYYLMSTQKNGLVALCGGSTFLEIGKKQLITYMITIPEDLEEQTAIATVLADMDAELAALEARRNKTRDLKQAMMQELLTGKTRLI